MNYELKKAVQRDAEQLFFVSYLLINHVVVFLRLLL